MGYAYITFDKPVRSDAFKFLNAVALGADEFRCAQINRDAMKAGRISGISRQTDGRDILTDIWKLKLEAFGPTKFWVEQIVARELREHPSESYETRFGAVEEMYDGFRAKGFRLAERKQ